MSIKDRWQKFKEEWSVQKEIAKQHLKGKWDIGAEQGKKLKEEHRKKVKGKKNEG